MVSLQAIQYGVVGAGALTPFLIKAKFDGEVPLIGQYMMGYGTWSTGGSIAAGAALVLADSYFHKVPQSVATYSTPFGAGLILGGVYNSFVAPAIGGVTATSIPRAVPRVQAMPRVEKLVY